VSRGDVPVFRGEIEQCFAAGGATRRILRHHVWRTAATKVPGVERRAGRVWGDVIDAPARAVLCDGLRERRAYVLADLVLPRKQYRAVRRDVQPRRQFWGRRRAPPLRPAPRLGLREGV